MGMTIDEALHHLHTYSNTLGSGQTPQAEHEEAKRVAIDVMRKYQKIQEIARWNNSPSPYYKPDGQLFREICEVLEDGNVNNKI